MSKTTVQVHLYPTPEQGRLLMAHCLEYISTVNVLASALDADMLPEKLSTPANCEAMIPKLKRTEGEPIRTLVHVWRGVSVSNE